jgi:hypothetical protein
MAIEAPAVTGNLAADIATDAANITSTNTTVAANVAAVATGAKPMAALTGNPLADLLNAITAQGNTLIVDLQNALNLANYQLPGGTTVADPIAATAIQALIPLVQLVINGPPAAPAAAGTTAGTTAAAPSATSGIMTEAEKLRIVAITVQSTAFKQAVSPFVVDTVAQVQGLINGMMTLFTGAGITGLIAIPKIP